MIMIFKNKFLTFVQSFLMLLSLGSVYAADMLSYKDSSDYSLKQLRKYSEEQLLDIISKKIRSQQELLEDSSDSALEHYISTVLAISVSAASPFCAAEDYLKRACGENQRMLSKVCKCIFTGPWYDAQSRFLGMATNLRTETGLIKFPFASDNGDKYSIGGQNFLDLIPVIERQLKPGPCYRFLNPEAKVSKTKKEALVYMAKHGEEVWKTSYESIKAQLSEILEQYSEQVSEQKLIEMTIRNPIRFSNEWLDNPYASFYIKEIYKAEAILQADS